MIDCFIIKIYLSFRIIKQENAMKTLKSLIIILISLSVISCYTNKTLNSETAAHEIKYWKNLQIDDFGKYHSPVDNDEYKHLIFGNIPVSEPADGLSPELSEFLGRWEGYDYSTPVKRDIKVVLVIQEISCTGGRAYLWGGNNLQFPFDKKEIEFTVINRDKSAIAWGIDGPGGTAEMRFSYNKETKQLEGGIQYYSSDTINQKIILERNSSFYIYREFEKYLTLNRITLQNYKNTDLKRYGKGYLIYLPEEYKQDSDREWPLIIYLCGSGERGDNLYLMPKIGPLRMALENNTFPFVIAAPGLNDLYRTFPDEYMGAVLDEIISAYNIDKKRVYVTGISMGGEASYRLGMNSPGKITAIAPLCAANPKYHPTMITEGFSPFEPLFDRIRNIPVRAVHGADDTVIPLSAAQKTVEDFKNAGVNIELIVLDDHDHDVWTDTYLSMDLYEWFLKYTR
jgi:hypothetical protein